MNIGVDLLEGEVFSVIHQRSLVLPTQQLVDSVFLVSSVLDDAVSDIVPRPNRIQLTYSSNDGVYRLFRLLSEWEDLFRDELVSSVVPLVLSVG